MKILYVTTISLTMNSFFKPHIQMLVDEGVRVEIACNDKDLPLDRLYEKLGCKVHRVAFSRSPLSPGNIRAYRQLKKVIESGNYDIVHCHTPNASVVTRLACRKFRKRDGLKVFYTAHGFHFYKGAPILNWMIYYPVEKFCSRFTDKLITINQEDHTLAKKKFQAKKVCYAPGIGIDLSRFQRVQPDTAAKRREIGVLEDAFLLLSVGELNKNKNHQLAIRALAELHAPTIHYAIAGTGDQKEQLLKLAESLGVSEQVHLLGYRTDVEQIYKAADAFCLPSYREGLSVSLMEAMGSGLPVVCSRIRGNVDLICENGGVLFDPHSVSACRKAIEMVIAADRKKMGENNRKKMGSFSITNVIKVMRKIYEIS